MNEKKVLNEKETALYIGMSCSYLRQARMNGTIGKRNSGPPYLKQGRSVRYRVSDLDTWIEKHLVQ